MYEVRQNNDPLLSGKLTRNAKEFGGSLAEMQSFTGMLGGDLWWVSDGSDYTLYRYDGFAWLPL